MIKNTSRNTTQTGININAAKAGQSGAKGPVKLVKVTLVTKLLGNKLRRDGKLVTKEQLRNKLASLPIPKENPLNNNGRTTRHQNSRYYHDVVNLIKNYYQPNTVGQKRYYKTKVKDILDLVEKASWVSHTPTETVYPEGLPNHPSISTGGAQTEMDIFDLNSDQPSVNELAANFEQQLDLIGDLIREVKSNVNEGYREMVHARDPERFKFGATHLQIFQKFISQISERIK